MMVHLSSLKPAGLVEAGVLPVLIKLLETSNDKSTRGRVLSTVFRIALNTDLRKQLNEAGLPAAVERAIENSRLPEAIPMARAMERNVKYDLSARSRWNFDKLISTAKFWLSEMKPVPANGEKGVLISFEKDDPTDKATVLRIQEALKNRGFNVWVNLESEDTTVMAQFMANSYAVLMGYSSKLLQSDHARSELEYARKNKIPMIPCIIEPEFKASGWLDIILGEKLFCDFAGKKGFDVALENCIKEIQNVQKKLNIPVTSSATPATAAEATPAPAAPSAQTSVDGDLDKLLERAGLAGEVGPILADQGIDSVELFKGFTFEELVGMGIKRGHAKKLQNILESN
jgi:hypothetical protein